MTMIYTRDNVQIQYTLKTNPPEAMYWTTHNLKKTDIKLITKTDKETAAQIRQEIFDDIISREPNQRKKYTPSADSVSKRSKATNSKHAQVRGKQQKARQQNKSKKVEKHAAVQPNSRRTRNVSK